MHNERKHTKNSPDFRENKFTEEETPVDADKAAKRPPSLNEVPKETNPQ